MTSGITYDTGALLAAERGSTVMWSLHRRILDRGVRPVVPAAVLGQAWRGGPQANLSRLLKACTIEDLTGPRARAAGSLCASSATNDVVDASVVVGAVARGDVVVSSDPDDLRRLAEGLRSSLTIITI